MTERPSTPIPAGWYPDPRGAPQRRWWDGSAWTHALETPEAPAAAPAYANLPGPVVNRAPSPSAPTVKRAIAAEEAQPFPTRRQLRDAAATLEMQRRLTEPEPVVSTPAYALGAAGSLRAASAGSERTSPVEPASPARASQPASRVVSTAAAASLSEAPVHSTGSAIAAATTPTGAAYRPTHTFTPAPAPAVQAAPAAPVAPAAPPTARAAAAPVAPAVPAAVVPVPEVVPVTAPPVTAPPVAAAPAAAVATPPVTPTAQAAQAAPASATPAPAPAAPAAGSAAPATTAAMPAPAAASAAAVQPAPPARSGPSTFTLLGAESKPFTPVMRSGSPNPPIPAPDEIAYQPFGMNPRIRTGVMERPTTVHTAAAWTIAVLPGIAAGILAALVILAPGFATLVVFGGLCLVLVIASVALAAADRRILARDGHTVTASPLWALLTAPPYLLARAVRTRQQAGRGWAPFVVSLLVAALVATAVALGLVPVAPYLEG